MNFFFRDESFTVEAFLAEGLNRRADILRQTVERAKKLNPILNCYITLQNTEAFVSSLGEQFGQLALLPLGVKDVFDTKGIVTTCGSPLLKHNVPERDARAVALLKDQGASIVGKTNTHEFAAGATCINPHYGAVLNPFNTRRISGGSSGGSAAAVAAGCALAALGTDTGGSVRIPAALCGVVGFKPSYGAVSRSGVTTLSWTMDHVGLITRCVADAQLLFDMINRKDAEDATTYLYTGPLKGKERVAGTRFGFDPAALKACSPAVIRSFSRSLDLISSLGGEITRIKTPNARTVDAARDVILTSEAAAYHGDKFRKNMGLYGADVRKIILRGMTYSSTEYIGAQRVRTMIAKTHEEIWHSIDFIASPTVPVTAPLLPVGADPRTRKKLIANTQVYNMTWEPATTIRNNSGGRLPTGLQIAAAYGQDRSLLKVAKQLERAIKNEEE